jgi:hypothetical protein
VKKILWLVAVFTATSMITGTAFAATPSGFSNTTVDVNARVGVSCAEAQHGAFPSPLIIDTQLASDQNFTPTADQMVHCTSGVVFTVNVSSANGTALDQVCTSGGVSGMLMQSASWPGDTIAYTFMCAGDTNGAGNFTGAGFTTARAMGISIKVLAADAQAALAHADYSDTVTLTISY